MTTPHDIELRALGSVPGIGAWWVDYPGGLTQRRHHHDHASLTVYLGGEVDEEIEGEPSRSGPLGVVFKRAGSDHAVTFGPAGATTLTLDLDEALVEELLGPVVPTRRWCGIPRGESASDVLAIVAAIREGRGAPAVRDRLVSALGSLVGEPDPGRAGPPSWLEHAAEALEAFSRSSDAPVRRAADAVGVHPVYLARTFRRHLGLSPTAFIRRRRVARAAERLASGRATISRAAHDTGFADHSHLCREFRELVGTTPSRFRGLARKPGSRT